MHGGAPGSGAPKGNRNALRHGRYTAQAIAMRREMRALLRRSHQLICDCRAASISFAPASTTDIAPFGLGRGRYNR